MKYELKDWLNSINLTKENLIADDHAHQHPQGDPDKKDHADRGTGLPVREILFEKGLLRQGDDIAGQALLQRQGHVIGVCARFKLDEGHFDPVR